MITALPPSLLREDRCVVGRLFAGYSNVSEQTEVFRCEHGDPRFGYELVNVSLPSDRALVYPSQLGTAYLPVHDRGDHWYVWRLGQRLPKPAVAQVA